MQGLWKCVRDLQKTEPKSEAEKLLLEFSFLVEDEFDRLQDRIVSLESLAERLNDKIYELQFKVQ